MQFYLKPRDHPNGKLKHKKFYFFKNLLKTISISFTEHAAKRVINHIRAKQKRKDRLKQCWVMFQTRKEIA